MSKTIAILCAGGPAPGINTVIGSVTKIFLTNGYRVLGIQGGYSTLFNGNPQFDELDFTFADRVFNIGGSVLSMSRYKPKNEEFTTDFFTDNNVELLVTIGGDDTASTANQLSNYLKVNSVNVKNIHVPKTIDNDLPLPEGIPTFGYQSAKQAGVKIATTVYEDARTSGNWFIISAMGREAGHLALGIGTSCHFPMIIIPEMFNKRPITLKAIVDLIISSIVKRKILGINYGVCIISEGVFHFMNDEEVEKSGINFSYDAHGHPELGSVSKAHIFNMLVQERLKEIKLPVRSRPVEIGYEVRCVSPIAYDLNYSTALGNGVFKLFKEGATGCVVVVDHLGMISPLYLKDVADQHGKIKPRLVNISSEKTQLVFKQNLHVLTDDDYESAKTFINKPEDYDFFKILSWSKNLT